MPTSTTKKGEHVRYRLRRAEERDGFSVTHSQLPGISTGTDGERYCGGEQGQRREQELTTDAKHPDNCNTDAQPRSRPDEQTAAGQIEKTPTLVSASKTTAQKNRTGALPPVLPRR